MISNQCNLCFLFTQLFIILAAFTNAEVTETPRPPYIRELKVPATIVNGSETDVVLDCDFRLDQNETALLVVKWFLNRDDLVYQWIYGSPPQSIGILQERVNLKYEASDVDFEKYRAMQISNPTSDLSGEYTCQVSTSAGYAYKAAKMTVYSPATEFDLRVGPTENLDTDSQEDEDDDNGSKSDEADQYSDSNMLNVTCWAFDVYPKPTVTLYYGDNDTNKEPLIDAAVEVSNTSNGAFDTFVHKLVDKKSIFTTTKFTCELKIVDTYYFAERKVYWHKEPSSAVNLSDGIWQIVLASTLLLLGYV